MDTGFTEPWTKKKHEKKLHITCLLREMSCAGNDAHTYNQNGDIRTVPPS